MKIKLKQISKKQLQYSINLNVRNIKYKNEVYKNSMFILYKEWNQKQESSLKYTNNDLI